jgi:YaiO family outer membrane protein
MTNRFLASSICLIIYALSGQAHAQATPDAYPGSVQLGLSQSRISNHSPDWRDVSVRGNVSLSKEIGVLHWEASEQKHFGETGSALSLSLSHELNPDWYGSVGMGAGSKASFLPKHRVDAALYRKWLDKRQWVTGVQLMASKSGDSLYRDQSWQLSSSYYFEIPLVAELGFKRNTSNPGNVKTQRYYVAATYGENKKYYLSARYDTGHEGYLPQGANVSASNFKSHIATLSWRQWLSPQWGYELVNEQYNNPFYDRNGWTASLFYDF